ncbi:MAG: hypothetical protein JO202_17435 [Ktedonobacteraceae bacterium]|nr:hypothetical protein [Ktedonobacteraceae bacterium]
MNRLSGLCKLTVLLHPRLSHLPSAVTDRVITPTRLLALLFRLSRHPPEAQAALSLSHRSSIRTFL